MQGKVMDWEVFANGQSVCRNHCHLLRPMEPPPYFLFIATTGVAENGMPAELMGGGM